MVQHGGSAQDQREQILEVWRRVFVVVQGPALPIPTSTTEKLPAPGYVVPKSTFRSGSALYFAAY